MRKIIAVLCGIATGTFATAALADDVRVTSTYLYGEYLTFQVNYGSPCNGSGETRISAVSCNSAEPFTCSIEIYRIGEWGPMCDAARYEEVYDSLNNLGLGKPQYKGKEISLWVYGSGGGSSLETIKIP